MYTINEFIKDCTELEEEELISIAIDESHIITAMKFDYIDGCDDEVQLELCVGRVEGGCNVCEELIEVACAKSNSETDILGAIEYLKKYI
jgi:hypothetical protein